MSDRTVLNFLAEVDRDESLARAFVATIGGKEGNEAVQAVADFITARGHTVGTADVEAARTRILDALDRQGELSEAELEEVAGGEAFTLGLLTLAGLGVAGGVVGTLGAGAAAGLGGTLISIAVQGPQKTEQKIRDFFSGW